MMSCITPTKRLRHVVQRPVGEDDRVLEQAVGVDVGARKVHLRRLPQGRLRRRAPTAEAAAVEGQRRARGGVVDVLDGVQLEVDDAPGDRASRGDPRRRRAPRPIDVRFLAATNRPLSRLMADGEFREDLYFRLCVFPIHIPPLRDRLEDVADLARFFLGQVDPRQGVDPTLRDDTLAELRRRPWTGNVRELRNAIERAAIIARGGPILPGTCRRPSTSTPSTPVPAATAWTPSSPAGPRPL